MKRLRWLGPACIAIAVLTAACVPLAGTLPISSPPAPQGCITDVGPAEHLVFEGCGAGITYNVSVPDRCLQYACGLIFDVHGWTMSGDIQEANTGIAAIGRLEGYIVVQPSAPDKSWSSSDYPLVADFMSLAIRVWRVEQRRVHFTGFSQGGGMTFWMRCNRADILASVAPSALSGSACSNGARPVPTLYIQGNNDIFVSEASKNQTIQSFVQAYGLDQGRVFFTSPGHTWTHYTNATGFTFGTLVHNYTSYGVNGHCVMGSLDPEGGYGCDQPTSLSHGRAVVNFFKIHAKG